MFAKLCVVLLSVCLAQGAGTQTAPPHPAGPVWAWESLTSYVPDFEEKGKDNKKLLVVEVTFRNGTSADQTLVVAKEQFTAKSHNGEPIEVLGLLFRMTQLEGAKRMAYTGGIKRMETLNERGSEEGTVFHTPGPVELTIEPGKSYRQRLLLRRPKGKKPIRLSFSNLPEIEVPLPR